MKKTLVVILLISFTAAFASPILQMNRAFNALSDLIPYVTNRSQFMEKKNAPVIKAKISELQKAFKDAKHDSLIKEDIFAPSYAVINESINDSLVAFNQGDKDFSHWRLKEITTHCLDCHTRLPENHTSSFQNGELQIDKSKFDNTYNLGLAQLIVRRYVDAKESFIKTIDEKMIKKEYTDLSLPFKQVLLIEAKVLKNTNNLIKFLESYSKRNELPEEIKTSIQKWLNRAHAWKKEEVLVSGIKNEKQLSLFLKNKVVPTKKYDLEEGHDVDLLIISGLLSNYLFENPTSLQAPEISYWLGRSEKYLKRDNFFGSGDRFLKQCIKKYPKNPIAKDCLLEYKESVEFDFTGSSGTNIPKDVEKELRDYEALIKTK